MDLKDIASLLPEGTIMSGVNDVVHLFNKNINVGELHLSGNKEVNLAKLNGDIPAVKGFGDKLKEKGIQVTYTFHF